MPKLSAISDSDHEESDLLLNDSSDLKQFPGKARLWTVTYVCVVAVHAVILSGFSLGFTSPVLSKLKDKDTVGYRSLRRIAFQDAFNVSDAFNNEMLHHQCNQSEPDITDPRYAWD